MVSLAVKLVDQYLKLQNLVKEAIVGIILMMVIVKKLSRVTVHQKAE